jgi:hypothetical protein
MSAPGAVADDPVINRIAPQVAFRSDDIYGWSDRSAHCQPAQPPHMGFGRKFIIGRLLGQDLEDGAIALPPSFELITRTK